MGYGRERIAKAVADQLTKMCFFGGMAGTIPGAVSVPYNEAADRLGELGCAVALAELERLDDLVALRVASAEAVLKGI